MESSKLTTIMLYTFSIPSISIKTFDLSKELKVNDPQSKAWDTKPSIYFSLDNNLENLSPPNPWKKQTRFQIGLLETFLHWKLENLSSNLSSNLPLFKSSTQWRMRRVDKPQGTWGRTCLTPQFGWKIEFHLAHFFIFIFFKVDSPRH